MITPAPRTKITSIGEMTSRPPIRFVRRLPQLPMVGLTLNGFVHFPRGLTGSARKDCPLFCLR